MVAAAKARVRRKKPAGGTTDVEHAHDLPDAERFNTRGTTLAYAPRSAPEPAVTDPDTEPTIVDLLAALPVERPRPATRRPGLTIDVREDGVVDVPEVMILPEPESNRPTVPLERGPVPGQAPPARPAGTPPAAPNRPRTGRDSAYADRLLQDRVRAERTAALLETSTFWQSDGSSGSSGGSTAPAPVRPPTPPRPRRRDPRRPGSGLPALLVLGLIATFFSWVSAEPFWLAVGHGRTGTATVAQCTGSGVSQRCVGTFTPAGGATVVEGVALLGVEPGRRAAGTATEARMVSAGSRQAYVGEIGLLMHLRWTLGFVLVLLCGLGIAGLTGAGRLETARARRTARLMSLGGPLLLLGGFLFVTY